MRSDAKSTLVTVIAFVSGLALGYYIHQRTDEHALVLAEWKSLKKIQAIVDLKLQSAVEDYGHKPRKEK